MPPAFRTVRVCVAIAAGVMGTAATAPAQPTVLVLDSQAGDYIGLGQRTTYSATKSTFQAERNYRNGVTVSVIEPDYASRWYLNFGSAGDVPLAVGSYGGAHRLP